MSFVPLEIPRLLAFTEVSLFSVSKKGVEVAPKVQITVPVAVGVEEGVMEGSGVLEEVGVDDSVEIGLFVGVVVGLWVGVLVGLLDTVEVKVAVNPRGVFVKVIVTTAVAVGGFPGVVGLELLLEQDQTSDKIETNISTSKRFLTFGPREKF
jgi:hypothetical protein